MKPQKRQFGEQLRKALGEGPGPRAVEAQKERFVAEAKRPRGSRYRWLLLSCALGLALVAMTYLLELL